ncbi:MAG: copper chaperone PCu(A)C [Gammaproteobacteria bacterium]|nr:MAG: copper chaperone PCu(A)C [Gammaproteobacteria bacterium]
MVTLRLLLLLILLGMGPLPAWAQVTVSGAWVREAPPGAPALAAYLVLHNGTDRPRTLVSVEADGFAHAMLHRSITHADMAHMEHVDRLTLAPGETLRLEPGSYHIMLMRPARDLREGDTVRLTLRFADGTEQTTRVPVTRQPPPAP